LLEWLESGKKPRRVFISDFCDLTFQVWLPHRVWDVVDSSITYSITALFSLGTIEPQKVETRGGRLCSLEGRLETRI
jgi:hypothetical protein